MSPIKKRLLSLALLVALPITAMADAPVAVPTFESIGLYWKGTAPLDSGNDAQVQFRVLGSADWQEGLPLQYDSRNGEYRGSLVHLAPGTDYEVQLTDDSAVSQTLTTRTWPETFPVAKTITLPTTSSQTLNITESGSPDGYVLYTAAPGSTATINVNKQSDFNVSVRASYVIIRGLTLRGAKKHGIVIGDGATAVNAGVTDVVIENNDISAWGSVSPLASAYGREWDSAIYSYAPDLARVVIQRNRLHHPSFDANNSEETHGKNKEPKGPSAISLRSSLGNHVIRHNEIYSDATHYFDNGMGGGPFFSATYGFPNRDSDIYGNYIANVWDNAVSATGANLNVRIWANYIDQVFRPFSTVATFGGPIYIWRNVTHTIASGPNNKTSAPFMKYRGYGDDGADWGGGRIYLFNNSALVPKVGKGLGSFVADHSGTDKLRNLVTLNNVMMVKTPSTDYSIRTTSSEGLRFDFDLINGLLQVPSGQALNSIRGTAKLVSGWGFDAAARKGIFALDATSPGFDRGTLIPNFVTTFNGAAPDIGAHEAGGPALEYGAGLPAGGGGGGGDDGGGGGGGGGETPPKLTVVLVGDSTVTEKAGWGLGFRLRAAENITVLNKAVSGTSSKSYRDLGYWTTKVMPLKADYILIQFGHNDVPGKGEDKETDPDTTYTQNMTRYVNEARGIGMKPILVTSLCRRYYDAEGRIKTDGPLTDYVNAIRRLAPSLNVPMIDLFASSVVYFTQLGPNGWQDLAPSSSDRTHLNEQGSWEVSRLVVRDLPEPLAPYFHTR